MLRQLTGLFRVQSQESLIKQYTQDLARITSQIHQLDMSLKQKDVGKSKWHKRCYIHGSGLLALFNAVLYVQLADKHFIIASLVVSLIVFLALKWGIDKWYEFFTQRTLRKVERLRAQHQEKLEALKQKTHFYSTNSLIKRFSSGQHQEEDAMTLMDEEMKSKYEELTKLKRELADFQKQGNSQESQVQRDKWFDKVLDIISGGDVKLESQLKPVICGNCKRHAGSYTVSGMRLQYVCPLCNWRYDSDKSDRKDVEKGIERGVDKVVEEKPSLIDSAAVPSDSKNTVVDNVQSQPRLMPK
ncbi:LAME_0G17634g1_1 [Lachancea meyersii CBS 8951]|uniref:LAME_0G17634g1_1 n=1 Tax=Lachancea meyersii CBS 8951 TaxID=1266667 RepID=A0A1G4KBM0_9SACH|nr:LAME_0G17634g1_1 [Lachancea meyersii CBS 8951]